MAGGQHQEQGGGGGATKKCVVTKKLALSQNTEDVVQSKRPTKTELVR